MVDPILTSWWFVVAVRVAMSLVLVGPAFFACTPPPVDTDILIRIYKKILLFCKAKIKIWIDQSVDLQLTRFCVLVPITGTVPVKFCTRYLVRILRTVCKPRQDPNSKIPAQIFYRI